MECLIVELRGDYARTLGKYNTVIDRLQHAILVYVIDWLVLLSIV